MKIALTGITGFVGMNLMPKLLNSDNSFLTINQNVEKAKELYPEKIYKNFRHVETSELRELEAFNPDIVIHLATMTTPRNDAEIIHQMISANIEFGVFLLDSLQKCSNLKLFVNTGTFAEYRYGCQKIENAYLYSASKTAFRAFVDYYANIGKGFKYITAIPYSVYGGKMTVKRLFDYIKESLWATEPVNMTKGEQVLDFIHVDDVAGFYKYVIDHISEFLAVEENGREFHLGTGIGTSIRDVATLIEKISGKTCNVNWGARPYRETDIMYAVAPVEKNQVCGWRAEINLGDGIKRFLNY